MKKRQLFKIFRNKFNIFKFIFIIFKDDEEKELSKLFGGYSLGDHNLSSIQKLKQLSEQKCCSDYSLKNIIYLEGE